MFSMAQSIHSWKIDLWDGRVLSTEGRPVIHDHRTGTSVFEGNRVRCDGEKNAWTNRPGVVRPVAR